LLTLVLSLCICVRRLKLDKTAREEVKETRLETQADARNFCEEPLFGRDPATSRLTALQQQIARLEKSLNGESDLPTGTDDPKREPKIVQF
jgi:hypothetical protein